MATNGNDTIFGTESNDSIAGLDGHDVIYGWGGNDTLDGGRGNDSLYGGLGNDSLSGGSGDDVLFGDDSGKSDSATGRSPRADAFNDTLDGGDGNDTLNGGLGNDLLRGGRNDDSVFGDVGNDSLYGDSGNDTLDGGDGNDYLQGNDGNDVLRGSGGDDLIEASAGNDTLDGGAGNDTLRGGSGNDVLNGGDGNDLIGDNKGDDTITGGNGSDTSSYESSSEGVYFSLDDNNNGESFSYLVKAGGIFDRDFSTKIQIPQSVQRIIDVFDPRLNPNGDDTALAGHDTHTSIENMIGSNYNDFLLGGVQNNQIDGLAGNDLLIGGAGRDTVNGGDGNDLVSSYRPVVLQGQSPILGPLPFQDLGDVLSGGNGNDIVVGANGQDTISGGKDNGFSGTLRFSKGFLEATSSSASSTAADEPFAPAARTQEKGDASQSAREFAPGDGGLGAGDIVIIQFGGHYIVERGDGTPPPFPITPPPAPADQDIFDSFLNNYPKGADHLFGGLGADTFVFNKGQGGVDFIYDFGLGRDVVQTNYAQSDVTGWGSHVLEFHDASGTSEVLVSANNHVWSVSDFVWVS